MANTRRQFLKNIGAGALGLAGSLALVGCNSSNRVDKKGEYEGNRVDIREYHWPNGNINFRTMRIFDNSGKSMVILIAEDNFTVQHANRADGRFDNINLRYVPEGHAFENYANPTKLKEIYDHVMNSGGKKQNGK